MNDVLLSPLRLSELELLIERSVTRALSKALPSSTITSGTDTEVPVSTDEAAKLFGIAKQTLYQNARKVKHTKRFGRLYFYPSDLREYLNAGKGAGL